MRSINFFGSMFILMMLAIPSIMAYKSMPIYMRSIAMEKTNGPGVVRVIETSDYGTSRTYVLEPKDMGINIEDQEIAWRFTVSKKKE